MNKKLLTCHSYSLIHYSCGITYGICNLDMHLNIKNGMLVVHTISFNILFLFCQNRVVGFEQWKQVADFINMSTSWYNEVRCSKSESQRELT
jgi:hypothetical protein